MMSSVYVIFYQCVIILHYFMKIYAVCLLHSKSDKFDYADQAKTRNLQETTNKNNEPYYYTNYYSNTIKIEDKNSKHAKSTENFTNLTTIFYTIHGNVNQVESELKKNELLENRNTPTARKIRSIIDRHDYSNILRKNPHIDNASNVFSIYPTVLNSQTYLKQKMGPNRGQNRFGYKGSPIAFDVRQNRQFAGNTYKIPQVNNYQRPRQIMNHIGQGRYQVNTTIQRHHANPNNYRPRQGSTRSPLTHTQDVTSKRQIRNGNSWRINQIIKQIDNDPFLQNTSFSSGEIVYITYDNLHPVKHKDGKLIGETVDVKEIKQSMLIDALKKTSTVFTSSQEYQRFPGQSQFGTKIQSGNPHQNLHQPLAQYQHPWTVAPPRIQDQVLGYHPPYLKILQYQGSTKYQVADYASQQKNKMHNNYVLQGPHNVNNKISRQLDINNIQSPTSLNQYLNPQIPPNLQTAQYQNLHLQNRSSNIQYSLHQNLKPDLQDQFSVLKNPSIPNGKLNLKNSPSKSQTLLKASRNLDLQNKGPASKNPEIQNPSNPLSDPRYQSEQHQQLSSQNKASVPETQNQTSTHLNPILQKFEPQNHSKLNQLPDHQDQTSISKTPNVQDQYKKPQNIPPKSSSKPYNDSKYKKPASVHKTQNLNQPPVSQNSTKQNKDSNLQNTETQNKNLNLQEDKGSNPNQQNPGEQNGEETTKFDPFIFDYNIYDEIPGWQDLIPHLTTNKMDKENITTTTTLLPPRPDVVLEAKALMNHYSIGYFTAFTDELFNILRKKPGEDYSLLLATKVVIDKLDQEGKLKNIRHRALEVLHNAISTMIDWGPMEVKNVTNSWSLHNLIAVLTPKLVDIIESINAVYTSEEGEALLKTLEDVFDYCNPVYTNDRLSSVSVAEKCVEGVLQPYHRLNGTQTLKKLFKKINIYIIHQLKEQDTLSVDDKERNVIDKKYRSFINDFDEPNIRVKTFNYLDNDEKYSKRDKLQSSICIHKNTKLKRKSDDDDFTKEDTKKVVVDSWLSHESERTNDNHISNNNKKIMNKLLGKRLSYRQDNTISPISPVDNYDSETQDSSYGNSIRSYEVQGLLEYYKVLDDETLNIQNTIQIKEQKKALENKIRYNEEHTDKNQESIYLYGKIITNKPAKKFDQYDRFKEIQYNYEKSHSVLNPKSREVVNFKVDTAEGDNFKPIPDHIGKQYVTNNAYKTKKKKRFNTFIVTNQTSSEISEDEDEFNEKEHENNRMRFKEHNIVDVNQEMFLENSEKKKGENLINIREESSYSDEEKELNVVISDAIRHNDLKYRKYSEKREYGKERRMNELSSCSNEEGIFKNNIYKAFGYNPDLDLKISKRKVF